MTQANKNKALELSAHLVLISCLALITTYSINNFIINPTVSLTTWAIAVFPLLAFVPSLLKRNLRSYQWLCFLIMIYLIQAILDIFSLDQRVQGAILSFFIMLLFSSAVFFLHGTHKQNLSKQDSSINAE